MLKRVLRGSFSIVIMLFAMSAAHASIYACMDARGKQIFQNRPCIPTGAARDHADQAGRHLLWTVTGPGGSAYLLGVLHFGKPEMYPLPPEMTQAYADSQALVVETDLTALDPTQIARIVAAKALYRDGTTLQQVLTPATWRQLGEVMKKFGSSAQLVERQKPWFVSLSLTSLALKRFGFDENLGIDNHFMKLAYKKKPIIQLETFDQQLDFLNGFSAAEQEEMLKETFQDIEKGSQFLADTLKAWEAGDAPKIDRLLNQEFRETSKTDAHMYRVLITERNAAMVDKLDRLLRRGGKYFVVMGAAHFVGNDGIVELLKAKGYRVQQD